MHDQPSCPSPSDGSPAHADNITQMVVLTNVINAHPAPITVAELVQELAVDREDFATRDSIERAVQDLTGVGLLHCHDFLRRPDALVLPTRVALHVFKLWEGNED